MALENSEEKNNFTPPDPVAVENDGADSVEDALGVLSTKEKKIVQEEESTEDARERALDTNNGDDVIRTVDVNDNINNSYNDNGECSSRIEEPPTSGPCAELNPHNEVFVEKDGEDKEFLEEKDEEDKEFLEHNENEVFVEKDGEDKEFLEEKDEEDKEFLEQHESAVDEGEEDKELWEQELSEKEEIEIEAASSPSSSGYAGGRGSSSAASIGSGSGADETKESGDTGFYDNGNGARPMKAASKRNINEDESSISWRKRKKHFFVLSNSGKPIYSRYGDEYKLAGFSATLQAIISFVENGGDHIKLVRAGNYQIIFLVKGPIYLVCISCTEEPFQALKGQLQLLYGQMLLILTKSIDKCFVKNSKFDMTPLLGGTDVVFSSLVHAFSWNPATYLHAYTCLPLPYSIRQAAGAVLQDVADSGVLFAILMCGYKVISLVGAQKAILHADDMLLLSNFVSSSESFRTTESFSPICLPNFNAMAFLYAYVQYIEVDTYLVLLTTNSEAFFHLKECRIRIENVLIKSKVLSEVQRSILDGGVRVEDLPGDNTLPSGSVSSRFGHDKNLDVAGSSTGIERINTGIGGPAGLWHFMYRSNYLDQYVASEYSPPINSRNAQKRLFRAYQNLYASMHDRDIGPHKMQYRKDENYVLLCWITQDFELYAAFDPLAEKNSAIAVCNRVCQWIRDIESEIFLMGASPLSW